MCSLFKTYAWIWKIFFFHLAHNSSICGYSIHSLLLFRCDSFPKNLLNLSNWYLRWWNKRSSCSLCSSNVSKMSQIFQSLMVVGKQLSLYSGLSHWSRFLLFSFNSSVSIISVLSEVYLLSTIKNCWHRWRFLCAHCRKNNFYQFFVWMTMFYE